MFKLRNYGTYMYINITLQRTKLQFSLCLLSFSLLVIRYSRVFFFLVCICFWWCECVVFLVKLCLASVCCVKLRLKVDALQFSENDVNFTIHYINVQQTRQCMYIDTVIVHILHAYILYFIRSDFN